MGLGGAGWVKSFSVGICDGAPSTAHSSLHLVIIMNSKHCVENSGDPDQLASSEYAS